MNTFCLVDHRQLVKDLHELSPQWRMFGIYLGIPIHKLDGLQGEASMVDRCFTDVLVRWLNEGATVEQLIKALKSPGVNHGRLANEIERNKSGELLLWKSERGERETEKERGGWLYISMSLYSFNFLTRG